MHKFTLLFALTGTASAANSIVSVWLPGADNQTLVGSIIASDKTATTYSLGCVSPDADDCGVPTSFSLTEGPSTIHYILTDGYANIELACQITDSKSGVCTGTAQGQADSSAYSTVVTTTVTDAALELNMIAVTITTGPGGSAANTPASTTGGIASTGTSSATGSGSSSASSTKASGSSASKTGSATDSAASATGSGASSSSSKAGAAAMITQAPWIASVAAAGVAAMAYAAL